MLALSVPKQEIRQFMNMLLKEDIFDEFQVRSVIVNAFVRLEIDGLLAAELPSETTVNDSVEPPLNASRQKNCYAKWAEIKPHIFNFIKGRKQPRMMKYVFSVPEEKLQAVSEQASALFLNILFENGEVLITTGNSGKVFSLDKSLDHIWDNYVRSILSKHNVHYE